MVTLQQLTDAVAEVGQVPCQQDPETWFRQSHGTQVHEAKTMCETACEVRDMCRAYALGADERYGVWGGLDSPDGYSLRPKASSSMYT